MKKEPDLEIDISIESIVKNDKKRMKGGKNK